MIFEMRTYQLKVGVLAQYMEQFGRIGLPVVSKYCRLVGYWSVETGALNKVIHIWQFDSLDQRAEARRQWWSDPDWLEGYLPLALPLVVSQETTFLSAAPFSPIR